jgi:hypothetical protein
MTKLQREMARLNLRRLERRLAIVHDPDEPIGRRKKASRHAAALAEKLGMIRRPELCEGCGRQRRLERHHPVHFEPLRVEFYCRPCHRIADGMAITPASATSA